MSHVQVHLYGIIRHIATKNQTMLDVPHTFTLKDVIDGLAAEFGDRLQAAMLSDTGELQEYVKVFVNGDEVEGGLTKSFTGSEDVSPEFDFYFVPIAEGGDL